MVETKNISGITWIDVTMPTREEVKMLIEEHDVSPDIVNESLLPSPQPIVAHTADMLYVALHVPVIERSERKHSREFDIKQHEVDFIVREKTVITIHYAPFEPFIEFNKILEVNDVTGKRSYAHGADLFFDMLHHIVDSERQIMQLLLSELDRIEPFIFSGKEKQAVKQLSHIGRSILHFKRTFSSQRNSLHQIRITGDRTYFDFILHEYSRVSEDIELGERILHELQNANMAMLQLKEYDIIRTLTIISCTLLLPTFIHDGAALTHAAIAGDVTITQIGWAVVTLSLFFGLIFFLMKPRAPRQ